MSSNTSSSSRYQKRSQSIWAILFSTVMVLSLRNIGTATLNSALYIREGRSLLSIQQNKARVAVVVTTGNLDNECTESRLRHWVKTTRNNETTATPSFDIWVSYRRPVKLWNQTRYETIVASIADLNHYFQHEEKIATFDTKISGTSKSSFLRFAQEHSQSYDYVWHVEDDVFYTGQWKDFLDDENLLRDGDDPQNTIVTSFHNHKQSTNWAFFDSCSWNGTKCGSFGNVHQVGWMMIRFPMKLALKLWQDVSNKKLLGYHEAVVGTFCALHNDGCRIRTIPSYRIGSMQTGHTRGNDPSIPVERWEHGKIYHPVKCWAFPEPGSLAKLLNNYTGYF